MAKASIDKPAFQSLFHTMIWDVTDHWKENRSTFGKANPYLSINSTDPDVDPEVNLYRLDAIPSSNHGIIAQQGVIHTAVSRVRTLRQMAINASPIFAHPLMKWEIRVIEGAHSDNPTLLAPVVHIYICNDCISHYHQIRPEPISLEAASERLAKLISDLQVLDAAGARVFEIGERCYPGNSPEEALFLYDTLLGKGFTHDESIPSPTVREVFAKDAVLQDLRARFAKPALMEKS